MKKLLLLLIALLPLLVTAQVKFTSMTFAEAQVKAQKAGKQLLVDVSRGSVDKNIAKIFSDKKLSNYINKNFLAVRIDMNKKENSDFGQYLYSLMYPCVVFYTNRGEQLESTNWHSISLGKANLMDLAQKSMELTAIKRANSRQINFRDLDYKQALEVAKKEGKLLFIDNYTTWCRPCKQMDADVFTLNSVADFYNDNFVCIKLDADKDPYKVAKNNGVRGFPGYLYFDTDGGVILSEGGFTPEKKFIAFAQNAVDLYNNNKEIDLKEITLDEAKVLAKKEGKMIFVNLSATWCGPCKELKATTFKIPAVARYYNQNFINVYVECDIKKDMAAQMKKDYGYSAFPTMLYLSTDGKLIHKFVGAGMKGDEFITIAKTAVENKGLTSYNERYAKGEKTVEFIKEYIEILGKAYESELAGKVTTDYLNSLAIEELVDSTTFAMMQENVKDLDAKPVQLVLANKAKFTEPEMAKKLKRYEYMLWSIKCSSFAKRSDEPTFDKDGYKAFVKRISASDLSEKEIDEIVDNSELNNAETMGDWETYVKLTNKKLKSGKVSDMVAYNWALRVSQKADAKSKAKFLKVFEVAVKEETAKKSMWSEAYIKVIEELKK